MTNPPPSIRSADRSEGGAAGAELAGTGRARAWLNHPVVCTLALLVLLLCLMPPDGVLSDNEEDYFALAQHGVLRAVSPDSALFDSSRHRAANEVLLGGLIAAFGFSGAQIIGRSLAAIAFAFLLAALFRRLALAAVDAVLVVVAFALLGQTLFGGEWLFAGFEAKVVAYGFVLAGLAVLLGRRAPPRIAALFAAATWFHFLVGGVWFLAAMGLWLIEDRRDIRRVAATTALFALFVAPLIAVIAWSRVAGSVAEAPDLPSPDVIYAIIRAPWHASPFLSRGNFIAQWLPGYLLAAGMLGAALVIARTAGEARLKALAWWLAALLAYFFVALLLAFFDRDSGILGKFYLFRPAALTLLLWLALVAASLDRLRLRRLPAMKLAALAVLAPLFFASTGGRIMADLRDRAALADEKHALAAFLAAQTPPGAVVLIDPQIEWSYLDFERRTGHPSLVMFKFIPTNDREIIEWYRRMAFRRDLFEQGCLEETGGYRVDFLLTSPARAAALARNCGPVVYASPGLALLRYAR